MKLILKTLLAIGLVVGIIAFAVVFGGCASFEEPAEPLHNIRPVDFNQWKSDDIQPCIVARDREPWRMVDEVRNCQGWVPL